MYDKPVFFIELIYNKPFLTFLASRHTKFHLKHKSGG